MELLHTLAETFEKVLGLRLILETRHKVIGKPVQIRFTRIVKKLKRIIFAAFTVSPLPAPHLAIRRAIAHTHSH